MGGQYSCHEKGCQVTSEQIKAGMKSSNDTADSFDREGTSGSLAIDENEVSANLKDATKKEKAAIGPHCSCRKPHAGSESNACTFSQPRSVEQASRLNVHKRGAVAEQSVGHSMAPANVLSSVDPHDQVVSSHSASGDIVLRRPITRACSRLGSSPLVSDLGKA